MDTLFSVQRRSTGRKADGQEADWLHPPPSGVGRLLAAVAIIGIVVSLLDHTAGKSPAVRSIASTYDSSQQGR
jgi:hypothetical protein